MTLEHDDGLDALVRRAREHDQAELPEVEMILDYLQGRLDEEKTQLLRQSMARSSELRAYVTSIGEDLEALGSASTRAAFDDADVEHDVQRVGSAVPDDLRDTPTSFLERLSRMLSAPRTLAYGTGIAAVAIALLVVPDMLVDGPSSDFVSVQSVSIRGLPQSTFRAGDVVPALAVKISADVEVVELAIDVAVTASGPVTAIVVASIDESELFRREVEAAAAGAGVARVPIPLRAANLRPGLLDLRIEIDSQTFVARIDVER